MEPDLSQTEEARLLGIIDNIAVLNQGAAELANRAPKLSRTQHLSSELDQVFDDALDLYPAMLDLVTGIETLSNNLAADTAPPSLPRDYTDNAVEQLKREYSGPVLNIALQLVERNRYLVLYKTPETLGANRVRKTGLTENQREWLDQLQEMIE